MAAASSVISWIGSLIVDLPTGFISCSYWQCGGMACMSSGDSILFVYELSLNGTC